MGSTASRSVTMPSSSASVSKALELLLHPSTAKIANILIKVSEDDLQPGDMVLFLSESSEMLNKLLLQAGVYCGNGEVIQFQEEGDQNPGRVSKEGFSAMKNTGKCEIYRKKDGIDLDEFYGRVTKAMDNEANYALGEKNCLHFAFYLLDLLDSYMELVESSDSN